MNLKDLLVLRVCGPSAKYSYWPHICFTMKGRSYHLILIYFTHRLHTSRSWATGQHLILASSRTAPTSRWNKGQSQRKPSGLQTSLRSVRCCGTVAECGAVTEESPTLNASNNCCPSSKSVERCGDVSSRSASGGCCPTPSSTTPSCATPCGTPAEKSTRAAPGGCCGN